MPLICQQCRTPLRVADRSRLKEPFECPECSALLAYNANEDNVSLAEKKTEKPVPAKVAPAAAPVVQESFEEKLKTLSKKSLLTKLIQKFNQFLKSPLAFVWIMASVFLLMFIVLVIAPIFSQRQIEIKKLQAELDRTTKEETPLAPELKPEESEKKNSTSDAKQNQEDKSSNANITKMNSEPPIPPKPEPIPKLPEPNTPPKAEPSKMVQKPKIKKEPPAPKKPEYSLPKNLDERFAQKIVRFEQKNPVTLQELLVEMEVLLDARIEPLIGDSPITKKLVKTDIQIDLKNTTVKEIFTELLSKAELTYRIGKDRIYIEALK